MSGADSSDARAAIAEDDPLWLFFPGGDGLLHVEARRPEPVASSSRLDDLRLARARAVVEAVVRKPWREGSREAFDQGTALTAVRLSAGGVVIVGLEPPAGSQNRGLSSRHEVLRLYSLVNSLAASVPGVESVALVWAGTQPASLGGHVDTSRPLLPSDQWVAADSKDLNELEPLDAPAWFLEQEREALQRELDSQSPPESTSETPARTPSQKAMSQKATSQEATSQKPSQDAPPTGGNEG